MATLIHNLKQIVQITDGDDCFLRGQEMASPKILNCPQSSLCVLINDEGIIEYAGTRDQMNVECPESGWNEVDGQGGAVLPGFVDAHSHPVFAGCRLHEFGMKLAGATYQEVQEAGGGILFTMKKTREASEDELRINFEHAARRMLQSGTTTAEAKSGYGLDVETELKMLRVFDSIRQSVPLEISATFCGAHAIPPDSDEKTQTELICSVVVSRIAQEKAEGRLVSVENIDVFCEKGNFSTLSTKKILEAGQAIGLHANFHAEELSYQAGAEMGVDIRSRAISHLEFISDAAIHGMASSGVVAVVLPSTAFILRLEPPPVRHMIHKDVIIALGSDFNPNAHCTSMPLIMSLACITMRMSMEEALVAATLNSAHSIGRGSSHGAISVGRVADLIVTSCSDWRHLIYQFAAENHLISLVFKKGKVVFSRHN